MIIGIANLAAGIHIDYGLFTVWGIIIMGVAIGYALVFDVFPRKIKRERPATIKEEVEKWKKNQLPKVVKRRAIVLLFSGILFGILGTLWVFLIGTYYSNLFLLFAVAAFISTAISFGGIVFYKFEK